MKAILYIGHGTRSRKGAEEARGFVHRVMKRIDIPIQELSFLELTEPCIPEGFSTCVNRGATEISVVPLFLLSAGHIKKDIPDTLAAIKKRYPNIKVEIKDPFGVQGPLLDGLAELICNQAGHISPSDSVLIVGRGSSDPEIHHAFAEIVAGLRERLGITNISVSYLASAEPSFDEGLAQISEQASGRVVVVPYLLFAGLLLSEVHQKVKQRQNLGQPIFHTGQLTRHSVMEEIVINRATE